MSSKLFSLAVAFVIVVVFMAIAITFAIRKHNSAEFVLPEGEHKALVELHCTRCHSPKLIVQNRQTREGWDDVIDLMQAKHGLWKLEPNDRKSILDYLETHLSPGSRDSMDDLGPRNVNPLPKE